MVNLYSMTTNIANFFKDILVPVDLSVNTEIAIKKALEFAADGTNFHLLHVLRYSKTDPGSIFQRYFFDLSQRPEYMRAETKMNDWRDYMYKMKDNITVSVWIVEEGSIQNIITNKAVELDVDLTILIKNSYYSFLSFLNTVNPAQLSQDTGSLVLSIKGKVYNKPKAMVVPITFDTTLREKELIALVCKKFTSKIHLITFITDEKESTDSNADSLLQVYKWLKTIHLNLEYTVLRRSANKCKAVINYAGKVNADTLLFHSKTEMEVGMRKKNFFYLKQRKPEYLMGTG
jgi:hypothetical protein